MTNQEEDYTPERARAAAEGRGLIQGLCGEKEAADSETAERERREKRG